MTQRHAATADLHWVPLHLPAAPQCLLQWGTGHQAWAHRAACQAEHLVAPAAQARQSAAPVAWARSIPSAAPAAHPRRWPDPGHRLEIEAVLEGPCHLQAHTLYHPCMAPSAPSKMCSLQLNPEQLEAAATQQCELYSWQLYTETGPGRPQH